MIDSNSDPGIEQAVRRTAGIAALRKLRRLVDSENAHERWKAKWALRLGAVFAITGIAWLVWLFSLFH